MKTNKIILVVLICSAGLYLNSCKKKEEAPVPTPANGELMMHLHTMSDMNEVMYDSLYVMMDGRKIIVTKAQLYISGIQLIKTDGSTYDVSGMIIFKKQEIEPYMLGSVPSGNYQSIKFNVGLSAATNSTSPILSDSALNRPDMWFGSSAQPSGFVFVNFQGKIDTTTAANSAVSQMQPFVYKIGTNAHLKNVSMPVQNFTVSPNQMSAIHLSVDYSKLFIGIQLNLNSNLNIASSADNTRTLATQITNNIPLMFSYGM
ncbi:MAG: hypothetical protein HY840_04435 [Bacteroidetes bacterium]|nr:hypothetical protein [Bacteroidota bacterium]